MDPVGALLLAGVLTDDLADLQAAWRRSLAQLATSQQATIHVVRASLPADNVRFEIVYWGTNQFIAQCSTGEVAGLNLAGNEFGGAVVMGRRQLKINASVVGGKPVGKSSAGREITGTVEGPVAAQTDQSPLTSYQQIRVFETAAKLGRAAGLRKMFPYRPQQPASPELVARMAAAVRATVTELPAATNLAAALYGWVPMTTNALPADAGKDGVPHWPYIARWRYLGPFPRD